MTEGTLRNILSVLSGCLRDACKYRLLEENTCTEVAWVTKQKNLWTDKEWLDEDDLTALEPFLETYQTVEGYPLGIGYQLVLYAGLTLSEAVALRWQDVDFEHRRISVRFLHGGAFVARPGRKILLPRCRPPQNYAWCFLNARAGKFCFHDAAWAYRLACSS